MLENSQDNFDYFPSLGRRKEVEACWVKLCLTMPYHYSDDKSISNTDIFCGEWVCFTIMITNCQKAFKKILKRIPKYFDVSTSVSTPRTHVTT